MVHLRKLNGGGMDVLDQAACDQQQPGDHVTTNQSRVTCARCLERIVVHNRIAAILR